VSRKSRIAVMILTATLVALSVGAVPGAMAKSSSSAHALRFRVVKRTSHYDVVKGYSHRFGVRRGAHKVTVHGFGRFKLVWRTPHFVFLRAIMGHAPPTPMITSPNSGAFVRSARTTIAWRMSSTVSSGYFRVSLKSTLDGTSTDLTATRIPANRTTPGYVVEWDVAQAVGAYRLWVYYYAASGSALASDVSDRTVTISPAPLPTPSSAPLPSSACQFGVHMDLTYNGDAWQRAQAIQAVHDVLRAQISRNSLLWHQVESVRGQRDWSLTDAVVAELASGGIEPLFAIYGSPSWANGIPESTDDYYLYVPTAEGDFEAWLADYVAFVKEAVIRYQGRVHKWEIGNEANEHYFWKPKPDPNQYARFYTAIRDAILSVDPQAQVAMGGLAGLLYCGPEDYTGMQFLKAMNARGIYPENVAIHPYCSKNQPPTQHIAGEGNFDDIQAIHDYLKTVNRPVSIWVTEWGWPVGAVTEQQQADYMRTSLDMIRSEYTYVTVATAFFDHDRPPFSYGLFDGDFNPRPAAYAFGSFVDSLK